MSILEMVTGIEPNGRHVRFLVDVATAHNIVRCGGVELVRFGELSKGALKMLVFVVMAAIGAVPVLLKAGVPALTAFFGLAGALIGYGLFLARQKDLRGIELELQPKRCVIRSAETTQTIEDISSVVVVNSHQFRDGTPATDGVSELFLEVLDDGVHCFAPIAREGSYGECEGLARAIGTALQTPVHISNR